MSFVKAVHPGAFDRADVHEHILAAVIRPDEAEAFLVIEELHCSSRHITLFQGKCVLRPRVSAAGSFEIWEKFVSPTRDVRRGQVVRPKLDRHYMDLFSWTTRLARKSL